MDEYRVLFSTSLDAPADPDVIWTDGGSSGDPISMNMTPEDARLIAAAPDLLAACEAGHDALDEGCRDCALVDRRGDVDKCPIKHCLALPAQATLRAAIAKAKEE